VRLVIIIEVCFVKGINWGGEIVDGVVVKVRGRG
jgi:hypothetical protein